MKNNEIIVKKKCRLCRKDFTKKTPYKVWEEFEKIISTISPSICPKCHQEFRKPLPLERCNSCKKKIKGFNNFYLDTDNWKENKTFCNIKCLKEFSENFKDKTKKK